MLEETESPMKNEILDKVANSSAIFKRQKRDEPELTIEEQVANSIAIIKRQKKDEPELTIEEKYKIANDLLDKNHVLFLAKFGKYLNVKLLDFFTGTNNYELTFYIEKLKRYFNNETRYIDIKNRRYEALKVLIEQEDYFSEVEMMRRNPLLYDHLIGKYLTEDDIKTRDNLDTKNITFVNLLMEKIDRDGIQNLKKKQQDDEDEVFEEFDSDSDESDDEEKNNIKWGEMDNCDGKKLKDHNKNSNNNSKKNIQCFDINYEEQQMLKKEFITHMYQSFLDGKDKDFDYSTVDDNEMYDNVDIREQDEEEKYFDSETPDESTQLENQKIDDNESDDELEIYMKTLQEKEKNQD